MLAAKRICLIEDDPIMGESLNDRFILEGFGVDWLRNGADALDALARDTYSIVISDVRLPDLSGEEVFEQMAERSNALPPFVFITAFASVDRAVEMLKKGAADYVTKPFDIAALVDKVRILTCEPFRKVGTGGDDSLGVSDAMRQLVAVAPRIADRARIVLITGESGVGKEVLAAYLHGVAAPDTPFVAVNCAAIPESLMESEMFGHERGAFTSADRMRKGYFEQAIGGTLFLDEIGELSRSMQVKLLRAIQERRIQRLGAERSVEIDTRIICATNQDLLALVRTGRFREDLYYRINVVHLPIPALRGRPDDILWLARRFLAEQSDRLGEPVKALSASAQSALVAYGWPGNARELKNRIERACVFQQGRTVFAEDLFEGTKALARIETGTTTLEEFLRQAEREYIESALVRNDGKVAVTAAELGVSRKTLWEKTRKYGLRADE